MELIKFLLPFLLDEKSKDLITPIFNHLKSCGFDFKKAIFSLTPEILAPIVAAFSNMPKNDKKSPQENCSFPAGVLPISNIADKDIIYNLNKLLSV